MWIFKLPTFIFIATNQPFIHSLIHSFIHSVVSLTTGPQSLQKRIAHWVRSSASPINAPYPLVPLTSFSSCLRLLPRLPFPSVFPSLDEWAKLHAIIYHAEYDQRHGADE